MGGPRLAVDREQFIKTVQELESKNTYESMVRLQEAIAASDFGTASGLSVGNVYQYLKKWDVKTKTQAGKRGAGLAKIQNAGVVRIPRGEKFSADPKAQDWLKDVRGNIRNVCSNIDTNKPGVVHVDKQKLARLNKMADRLEAGSMKAAVALNCVFCCNGETSEVKNCNITSCPLFMFRPWKETDNEFADVALDD